jgi:short-subunit dehydrogenase
VLLAGLHPMALAPPGGRAFPRRQPVNLEESSVPDRTIVITGASGGIGAALALHLASRGDRLALVARRESELCAVADRCGERALAIVADVTDRDAVRAVVAEAVARLGHVDAWVNNVGRGITRPVSRLTDDDLDEMMRVNVRSALYGMQEVLPHFIARGAGHIVNVSSMLGRVPSVPVRSAYNGAKHFLNAITANLRDELREAHPGITVSLVSPGVVATDFGRNAAHGGPDSRTLPMAQDVDEVAAVIAAVLDTRAEDVYTRPGMRQRVVDYFAALGTDPAT